MNTQETLVEEKENLKKLGFILKRMHLSSMASELEAQMKDSVKLLWLNGMPDS